MATQQYTIIERVDAGGMAEVFKARASSIQGIEKVVAIKRILPSLTRNKKFIAMFLDEARLSMGLNHANIVQVFDVGVSDNTYFLVMEFVEGLNLRVLWQAMLRSGRRVPVAMSIYMLMEVCKALAHAHGKKDGRGQPLNIVHRDVSPPNIMLSYEGEVKIMDFGLAKATSQLEATEPGVVKGKFSYLAPEAAHGHDVDHRSDIFSAGIVLWELLAGRRLFVGKSDLETVELIRRCEVPSLRPLNPDVTQDLDELVQRILAPTPEARFQAAAEMGDELAKYIFSRGLKVTAYDVGKLVNEVRSGKIGPAPAPQTQALTLIDRLIQDELTRFHSLEDPGNNEPSDPGGADFYDGSRPLTLDDLSIGHGTPPASDWPQDPGAWLYGQPGPTDDRTRVEDHGPYRPPPGSGASPLLRPALEVGAGQSRRSASRISPQPRSAPHPRPSEGDGSRSEGSRARLLKLQRSATKRPEPEEETPGGKLAGRLLMVLLVVGLLLAIGVGVSLLFPQLAGG